MTMSRMLGTLPTRGRFSMTLQVVEGTQDARPVEMSAGNPLQQAAATWRRLGAEGGLLLHGEALARAEAWAAGHGAELGEDEQDFLRECREARDGASRRRRQADLVRCIATVLIVGALVGLRLAWSWHAERAALQQAALEVQEKLVQEEEARLAAEALLAAESQARRQAATAKEEMKGDLRAARAATLAERARALSGVSQGVLADDQELAILLAIEAVRLARESAQWEWSLSQAVPALYRALGHPGWHEAAGVLEEGSPLQRVWLSPDGRALTVDQDDAGTVWDAATGQLLGTLEGAIGRVSDADWAPDGRWVAVGNPEGSIVVWDASAFHQVRRLRLGVPVVALGWSPDGTRLLAIDGRNEVMAWDVAGGEVVMSWRSAKEAVGAKWAGGGERVLADLGNGKAALLDGRTGDELLRCEADPRDAASADGATNARIHTAEDGRSWLYLVTAEDLAQVACAYVTRNLTPAEWEEYMGMGAPYLETCESLSPGQ